MDNPEKSVETFLQEIKNIPGVVNAANLGYDMSGSNGTTSAILWEGKNAEDKTQFHMLHVGYDLTQTLGYELVAGRTYSRGFDAGRHRIIFNEAAIKAMGLTNPVGKKIKWNNKEYEIIGVVKDFHFETLYEKVKPCFFNLLPTYENVVVKITAGTERETLARLQDFYQKYVGLPLNYRFLDEDYQQLYAAENRVAVLSRYFAGIAILISCLGLFGLAAFTAERRRKEIGVRKLLGASRFSIVYLLSGDFTKLVVVAICLSLPVSYLLVKHWLQSFEYRIDLEWWYFIGAGLAALVIAWLTVGTQALKAASVNPVNSLKDE